MNPKITSLENEIIAWQRAVDEEGVWLFLAALGCWGVPNRWFQIIAFIVALILFLWRLCLRRTSHIPFARQIEELKKEVRGDSESSNELDRIAKSYLTISAFQRSGIPYLLCWLFTILSFFYNLKDAVESVGR